MKKWRHLQKTDGKILFTNEKDMSKEKERGCLKKKCIGRLLVFFFIYSIRSRKWHLARSVRNRKS